MNDLADSIHDRQIQTMIWQIQYMICQIQCAIQGNAIIRAQVQEKITRILEAICGVQYILAARSYFAAGRRKILERVTTERALSGSVTFVNSSAIVFCSSSVRRARSAAKAAAILSSPDMSAVA